MEQALGLASIMTQVVRCLLLIGGFISAEGEGGRHLSSFTFRWSAKTNAEERIPKYLKYLGRGRPWGQEEGGSENMLLEIRKRTDGDKTRGGCLNLDVARNSC